MKSFIKNLLLATLTGSRVSRAWAPFMRGRGTIFMLHRFSDPELGSTGHDPILLREILSVLRRENYDLIDLMELFRRLREGAPNLDRAVAFTMDDGYLDQGTVGGKAFAEFDCPVTTFVTTGFLDGALWFWWDRIEYAFDKTDHSTLAIELGTKTLRYSRDPLTGFRTAQADFTARCKRVPEAVKLVGIRSLAAAADVDLPDVAPLRYAPLTWDLVRALESRGMTFGPHTVTHPVLAQASGEQSQREIEGSWRRLEAEAAHPTPIFCYPNGQSDDFSEREIEVLQALGFAGAVVGTAGYAQARAFAAAPGAPFRVRRFAYPDNVREFKQCASGLESVNQLVRGLP